MMQAKDPMPQTRISRFFQHHIESVRWAATLSVIALLIAGAVFLMPEEERTPSIADAENSGQNAGEELSENPLEENVPVIADPAEPPDVNAAGENGTTEEPSVPALASDPAPEEEDGKSHNEAATIMLLSPAGSGVITLHGYGYCYNPNTEDFRFHRGLDFALENDMPVIAAAAGTVEEAALDEYWGGTVILTHEGGWRTIYRSIKPLVQKGADIEAGQVIGLSLSAPAEAVEAPHIHFELELDGESRDPALYLKK